MSEVAPALRVQDRSVVLRTVKPLGRVLDAEGRSVRSAPLVTEPDAPPRTGGEGGDLPHGGPPPGRS